MKHTVNLSIYLVLALIVWWSITADYSDDNQLQQAKSNQYAEIFMNEFKMTTMGENGRPSHILQGSRLQRDTGSNNSIIEQPVFQLLQGEKRWKITADQAIVNDRNETVQLKNNVVMQQLNAEPATTLRTEYLLIQTKTQVARTNKSVEFTRGRSLMRSNGMVFNNIANVLVLKTDVNGYFATHD